MNSPLLLQMITNQLKEMIIQGGVLYIVRSFLQVDFYFQYQLIDLVRLSFDFFWLTWSFTICFFVALYSCVSSCPRISRTQLCLSYPPYPLKWTSYVNHVLPLKLNTLEQIINSIDSFSFPISHSAKMALDIKFTA